MKLDKTSWQRSICLSGATDCSGTFRLLLHTSYPISFISFLLIICFYLKVLLVLRCVFIASWSPVEVYKNKLSLPDCWSYLYVHVSSCFVRCLAVPAHLIIFDSCFNPEPTSQLLEPFINLPFQADLLSLQANYFNLPLSSDSSCFWWF